MKILGVSGETLTAKQKYPVWDLDNLMSPIQMELSEEGKTFGQFFVQFMESTSNFKHLERKNDLRSQFISEITDLERLGLTVNMLMGPKSA